MATGTTSNNGISTATRDDSVSWREQDRYIETRLKKTRTHVKLNDIIGELMVTLVVFLSFLLAAAVIDHWVLALGFWGRLLALISLLVLLARFAIVGLVPLFLHRINPVYAARMLEETSPAFQNSLINFLMLRSQRSTVRSVIFEAVQEKAAEDLSHINIESAVDRSHVIKIGYVLLGVVLACAVYMVTSSKDPLKTAYRVIMPWADIERPSSVEIKDVRIDKTALDGQEGQGEVLVYQGQSVVVSAEIRGLSGDEDESATLYYTTVDEQVTEQAVPLEFSDKTLRYQSSLPPDENGLLQDVVFWIEAGDAVSRQYRIHVSIAPYIEVVKVSYDFPGYTKRQPEVVERQGDIRGLEGTRVTVHVRANQAIQSAHVHLQNKHPDSEESHRPYVRMNADGQEAGAGFNLALRPDRMGPQYDSYEVRFLNDQGDGNPDPVRHLIEVIADLPPEVEILVPEKEWIELPEDGARTIEIRALDPDFQLTSVILQLAVDRKAPVNVPLLNEPEGWDGAVRRKYNFVPRKLGLRAGQTVTYWAEAVDNRADPSSNAAEPNTTQTAHQRMKIVASTKPSDDLQNDRRQKESPADGRGPQQDTGQGGQPEDGQDASKDSEEQDADQVSDVDDQQSGDASSGNESQEPNNNQGQQSEQGGEKGQSPQDSAEQPGEGSPDEQADPSSEEQGDQDQSGSGKTSSSDGENTSQESSDSADRDGGESDGGDSGNEGRGNAAQESPREGTQGDSQQQSHGKPSGKGGKPGDQPSGQRDGQPLDSDGGDDGEVFEEVMNHLRNRDGQKSQGESGESSTGNEPSERPDRSPETGSGESSGRAEDQHLGEGAGGNQDGQQGDKTDKTAQTGQDSGQDGDNAPSDAGQDDSDQQGATAPQDANRDGDKQKRTGNDNQQNRTEDQASSPSTGKEDSDSESTEPDNPKANSKNCPVCGKPSKGDQSGCGCPGGSSGQSGKQPGKGSAGKGSAGKGSAGKGSAGKGSASEQQKSAGADQAESQESEGTSGTAADGESGQPGQPADAAIPGKGASGNPTAGGVPGGSTGPGQQFSEQEFSGDDPDLQYSRKATDLVLRHLKDQQDNPDRQLLEKLGWTQDDARRFVDRWQRMKQAARKPKDAPRAKRESELDRILRSLGLQPPSDTFRSGSDRGDAVRGLREAGGRSGPPPTYQEKYRAYQRSRAVDAGDH